jgi:hypothetical protein
MKKVLYQTTLGKYILGDSKALLEVRHLLLGDFAWALPVRKEVIDLSFFVMPL